MVPVSAISCRRCACAQRRGGCLALARCRLSALGAVSSSALATWLQPETIAGGRVGGDAAWSLGMSTSSQVEGGGEGLWEGICVLLAPNRQQREHPMGMAELQEVYRELRATLHHQSKDFYGMKGKCTAAARSDRRKCAKTAEEWRPVLEYGVGVERCETYTRHTRRSYSNLSLRREYACVRPRPCAGLASSAHSTHACSAPCCDLAGCYS